MSIRKFVYAERKWIFKTNFSFFIKNFSTVFLELTVVENYFFINMQTLLTMLIIFRKKLSNKILFKFFGAKNRLIKTVSIRCSC
jgi:hypothetical protein